MAEITSCDVKCKICNVSILVTDVRVRMPLVCMACRRFYQRHASNGDGQTLKCDSATSDCLNFTNKVVVSSSGLKWRHLCARCRFNKCQNIFDTRKTKPIPTGSSNLVQRPAENVKFVSRPFGHDLRLSEETFQTIVQGSIEFTKNMNARNFGLPPLDSVRSYADWWYFLLGHVERSARCVKAFVSKLPGFSALSVQDRCKLFTSFYTKAIVAEAGHHDEPLIEGAGMRNDYFENLIKLFPEFSYIRLEVVNSWRMLREWNPTQVEFAFLMAFLFYCNDDPRIENHIAVNEAQRQLETTYLAYLEQEKLGSLALTMREKRSTQMARLSQMFEEADFHRFNACKDVLRRCPDLAPMSCLMKGLLDEETVNPKKLERYREDQTH